MKPQSRECHRPIGDILPVNSTGISAQLEALVSWEESGGQACLCWFWMSTLYHLVSLYFPNLGSLGTLFILPSKPFLCPIPIIYSMVLSFQTRLKCHFLYWIFWYPGILRYFLLWGPSVLFSYWPWTQWFLVLSFLNLLLSLLDYLINPSRSCPIAPFIFVLSGVLITWHILSAL